MYIFADNLSKNITMMKEYKKETFENEEVEHNGLCESLARYSKRNQQHHKELLLFPLDDIDTDLDDIKIVELFAGVGGFRIGLERASKKYKTIWSSQWEPSTKRQDASIIYCNRFGPEGHSNEDITTVGKDDIPICNILVGGFPCQDYSVATTLKNSGGIQGKKGVLWWEICRILKDYEVKPQFLFLENVDRLLKSPATQRGRDFAIILASLSDLGYIVEWRVINAADYGMPQRRRRTYMVAYHKSSSMAGIIKNNDSFDWILKSGTIATSFPARIKNEKKSIFELTGNLTEISNEFNIDKISSKISPFFNSGIMIDRNVYSIETEASYDGPSVNLGDILLDEKDVDDEFFISVDDLKQWKYLKGSKAEKRVNKTTGFEYNYTEGSMVFPDSPDKPSRTIITGEGGKGASRFKHVVVTSSGRYRRLTPIELERLNMFPDNHTLGASNLRRAFLMGNALVTGIVEEIGRTLINNINRYGL